MGYGEEVKGHSFPALLKCAGAADGDQMTVNRVINDCVRTKTQACELREGGGFTVA